MGPDERARGLDFAGRLGDAGADADVADAAEGAGGGGGGAERDDGGGDGDHPADPCRRAADARRSWCGGWATRRRRRRRRPAAAAAGARRAARRRRRRSAAPAAVAHAPAAAPAPAPRPGPLARYAQFEDVVALVRARRDVSLLVEIEAGVRLVRYAPGRIEFEPAEAAPPDLAARLAQRLQLWTGARWGVAVVGSGGARDDRRGAGGGEGRPARAVARASDGAGGAGGLPGRRDPRRAAGGRAGAGAGGRRRPRTMTTTGIRSIPFRRRAECSRVWGSLATWPRS